MPEKVIEYYVSILTKEDIINYSKKESMILSSMEIDIIYEYIKKYWYIFYKGNPSVLFNELKNKLSNQTYNKIIELYNLYKNNYL